MRPFTLFFACCLTLTAWYWVLSIADNGVGLDGDELPYRSGSMGARLVKSFAQRLDGQLNVRQVGGTCVEVRFSRTI